MIRPALLAPLFLLGLAFSPVAAETNEEKLQKQFTTQEQILLGGLRARPDLQREFSQDAQNLPAPSAVLVKWRAAMAIFAQDYLGRTHPIKPGKMVQEMVEPEEWGALMATMRVLSRGSAGDQIKMRIFVGMLENADKGLKEGDDSAAMRVIGMARPELAKALESYSDSETARSALAEHRRAQELAARTAQEQAEKIREETERARQAGTPEEAARLASRGFHNQDNSGDAPVDASGGRREGPGTSSGSPGSTGQTDPKPPLTVKPPETQKDDMEELRRLKEGVSGHKAIYAGIGGALLGGLLGFLLGGPIGAAIGAVVLGGAAWGVTKWLFG